jgi:GLPGLI family protein
MISRLLPLLITIIVSQPATGPIKGTIMYERKIDVHRHLPDEQMKAMVPQFQTAQYQLLYRDSLCFYNAVPNDEQPDPFDNPTGGGTHIVMKFGGPGDAGILFRNYSSGQLIEQTTLAEAQYLINDTIHSLPWKLSADTLTILGQLCKKATATARNNAPVIAWYCENIPLPVGPDKYGGLPGAILKIDIDNGGITFTATKLSPAVDEKSMKVPSGKFITRAAFEKKLDEILGPPDSQGRRIIRQ